MHRWVHASAPAEQRHREEKERLIDEWWSVFSRHASRLRDSFRAQGAFDVPAFMREHLDALDDRLFYEFGSVDDLRDYLTITPEVDRWLRPFVRDLLAKAPRLPGWVFYQYRPAVLPPQFAASMAGRTGHQAEGWTATARIGEHRRIDITYYLPPPGYDQDGARQDAFVATEILLGEENLDEWVGLIDASAEGAGDARPLRDLPASFASLVEQLEQTRPTTSYRAIARGEWTLLKLEPAAADEYPEQRDLFVAKTCDLELWQATHTGVPFGGRRFSRQGETFCYLKLDGSDVSDEGFQDKSEIEDAIEAALEPAELGAFIGGGTGLRYSYIDLALRDVPRAVAAIQDVLRHGGVPRRSWLQFFAADMAAEWIGVYPDSPPPPMSDDADS